MRKIAAAFAALSVLAACDGCKDPVLPGPDADAMPSPDATSAGDASAPTSACSDPSDACCAALLNLARLGCREAAPGDAAVSYVSVCRHAADRTVFDLRPNCVARATSADEINRCGAQASCSR